MLHFQFFDNTLMKLMLIHLSLLSFCQQKVKRTITPESLKLNPVGISMATVRTSLSLDPMSHLVWSKISAYSWLLN